MTKIIPYLSARFRENGTMHSLILLLVGLLGWQLSGDEVAALTSLAIATLGGVNALTPESASKATEKAVEVAVSTALDKLLGKKD